MKALTDQERYTRVAVILHWAIATLIVFNLFAILYLGKGAPVRLHNALAPIHFSSGLTVLLLTVARVVWRLLHAPPPYPPTMSRWEKGLAHLAHFALYAVMVLMPLSGWALISAHPPLGSPGAAYVTAQAAKEKAGAVPAGKRVPQAVYYWWTVPLPMIQPIERLGRLPGGVPAQHELHEELIDWHALGGYLTLALLLLHVAGALKHQFVDRENEIGRMSLGRGREG